MKIELNKSALTTNNDTAPYYNVDDGVVEYRWKYPTRVDEVEIDLNHLTDNIADSDGEYRIGVYYRVGNRPEADDVLTPDNHAQPVIFEDTTPDDFYTQGFRVVTDVMRLLRESGMVATLKLRHPIWCLAFGVRVEKYYNKIIQYNKKES